MKIISGKIKKAQKIVIYGPEGIGKSTFASKFPNPVFLDTENSTKEMNVDRFEKPLSWSELGVLLKEFKADHGPYKTLVIDTADWAEMLCSEYVCNKYQKKGIEDFGYGKGYTYLQEEFGKLLNFLDDFIDFGINVVVTAHAKLWRVEQPEESGSYDRWGMKLSKGVVPLLKEWADMVLFANYKTYVVKDENDKVKAKGGQRIMYTTHHVCWDAKNRHGLPDEVPFEYSSIAHCIPSDISAAASSSVTAPVKAPEIASAAVSENMENLSAVLDETAEKDMYFYHAESDSYWMLKKGEKLPSDMDSQISIPITKEKYESGIAKQTVVENDGIPAELKRLMDQHGVTEHDIQIAVSNNNYYPADTPISKYDPAFINGKLIAGWDSFYKAVMYYKSLPFSGENNE